MAMKPEKHILNVQCELTQFLHGDGSASYQIECKDVSGHRRFCVDVKESNKNWRGKVTELGFVSLDEIFNDDSVQKYYYGGHDGNQRIPSIIFNAIETRQIQTKESTN